MADLSALSTSSCAAKAHMRVAKNYRACIGFRVSQNSGYKFRDPQNTDSILTSILGSPYLGKLPYSAYVFSHCPEQQ